MAHINSEGKIVYNQITRPVVVQANYLASMQDKHWVDDFISWYTGIMPWNWFTPGISHDEWGVWLDGELWFFSATSRPELSGKDGTRWIKAVDDDDKGLLRNPDRWLLQEKKTRIKWVISINEQICRKIERANDLIGLGYDFYGVFSNFTNPVRFFIKKWLLDVIQKLKKIYCSKAVHAVDTGWLIVISPRRRYKWAKAHGYVDIEDTAEYMKGTE